MLERIMYILPEGYENKANGEEKIANVLIFIVALVGLCYEIFKGKRK